MGRAPCCSKVGLHRGSWTADEDSLLFNYIQKYGEGHWRSLPKKAGLLRCGKSCRMRWMNYLRPDIKRGNITPEEDDLIIRLHSLLGNRWSLIARRLPGRTDNEIKNYWKSNLSKRLEYNTGTSEQRRTRESRNKTSTSTDVKRSSKKKQEKKKVAEDRANGRATEPKIHFPKALKVSPLSDTTRNVGGSPSTIMNPSPSHENVAETEASSLESAVGVAHNHGHDSSYQNHIPESDDYMLDDIFEKYQQLLQDNDLAQLDFVDSVLA